METETTYSETVPQAEPTENNSPAESDFSDGEQLTMLAASLLNCEEFVARYAVGNETVERAVIDRYLRTLPKTAPVMSKGSAVLAPLKRAKTLKEAKRLCEEYLKLS